MPQRGRKSAESLSAITRIPGQRPPPPAELTKEQAEEWRGIVSTKPVEWFSRDSQAILCELCRNIVMARRIAEQIDAFPMEMLSGEEGLNRYKTLGAMAERHGRLIATLSTKLRLTPQSRYEPSVANTAAKNSAAAGTGAARPWESAA
jgi:hypothetical protein